MDDRNRLTDGESGVVECSTVSRSDARRREAYGASSRARLLRSVFIRMIIYPILKVVSLFLDRKGIDKWTFF
jgi:hypothetical protein